VNPCVSTWLIAGSICVGNSLMDNKHNTRMGHRLDIRKGCQTGIVESLDARVSCELAHIERRNMVLLEVKSGPLQKDKDGTLTKILADTV